MNHLFDHMERAYEARCESMHSVRIDADEAAAAEIEAEAAAVWSRDVADLDEPALICNAAIGEALGEVTEDHDLRKIAELIRDRQYSALGILFAGLIEGYWERRCMETAEDLISARDKRAADDAAADRFYGEGR